MFGLVGQTEYHQYSRYKQLILNQTNKSFLICSRGKLRTSNEKTFNYRKADEVANSVLELLDRDQIFTSQAAT